MPSGAVHPNTGNFYRIPRLSVVDRVRKLVAHNAYEKRPEWLQFVERAPPMELWNLKLREVRIQSPYPAMVRYVLEQFPDMRFQDCFVDGNDWSKGNDRYRDDHPVMQFVARQLQLMNAEGGLDRKAAFEKTKAEYLERRFELEKKHKMEMALAQNQRIVPAFPSPLYTTGAAVARQREVELEVAHINHIRRKLRMLRKEIEPHDKRRMSAKEVALDVEAERTSYLPKISQSSFASSHEEEELVSEEQGFVEEEEGEEAFEFLSPANDSEVVEPSIRDKFVRPVEVSELESVPSKSTGVWDSFKEPENLLPSESRSTPSPILQRKEVDQRRPASSVLKQAQPSGLALSRPDRQTVKAILERKRKEEVEKRIGREPGTSEDGGLDYEDFMNMIKNKKG